MITVNTFLFDINGVFIFHNKDIKQDSRAYKNVTRRVTRTKLLDESVYISDSGSVAGDNDISITVLSPTKALNQKMSAVFELHSQFTVSTDSGVFLAFFESLRYSGGNATIKFLVNTKI